MVFEPYSEVVLPPDKGTGISRKKGRPEEKHSLPAPKEYKRSADSIAIDHVEPNESLAHGTRGKVLPATEQQEDVREQPIIIHPLIDDATDSPPDSKGEGTATSSESEVSAASAGSGVTEAQSDASVKSSPSRSASAGKKANSSRPSSEGPKDFIVAYNGRFIGHFRSEKRISNRKVFEKAARRLQEGFDEFDIRLLEIYKPVKLKVDVPEDMSKIAEGDFQWF